MIKAFLILVGLALLFVWFAHDIARAIEEGRDD